MKRHTHYASLIFAVAALVSLVTPELEAAGQAPETDTVKTISLGLVSQIHQKEIEEHFRDFVGYVARKLSSTSEIKGTVVVAPTALQLAKLLEEKRVDFYMESPYPTYLINRQGSARLLLRRWKGGMGEYRGILATSKESGIARLEDLRGKIIAFEDPGSTSAYLLPKVFLLRKGFRLTEKPGLEAKVSPKEIGYIFASTHKNIADLLLSKKVVAGAFSDDDYATLDEKARAEIAILAETETVPRHLVSIRRGLHPEVAKRLQESLLSMHQDDEGRKIMQKMDNTTKFDVLPGGEEVVRRKLVELFRFRGKK